MREFNAGDGDRGAPKALQSKHWTQTSLIVRWSCSNRLISGMCRRDTQIRVSWSLGINFRWASDWGVGSTYGGQAAIFDELRARVVIWPPPSTNPNLRIIDIAAVSRIAHLLVP